MSTSPTHEPLTDDGSDTYDQPSQREADAARAIKSALIGVLFCPLQLYTAWLLVLVSLGDERLRKRYAWYAVGAAAILAVHASLVALLLANRS